MIGPDARGVAGWHSNHPIVDRNPGDDWIVLQWLGFGRLVARALFGLAWFRDGAELHDLAVEHNMISRSKVNMCHVNWFPTVVRLSLVCLGCGVVHAEAADPALQPPTINTLPNREYADDTRRFQGIPGIERAANGRLWAVWYAGGADESAEGPGNYVVLVTSGDDGKTWSGPKLVIDPPGEVRAYDPCLWHDPNGKLWLFWAQSYNWWDGRSGVWCTVTDRSGDEATPWTAPRRLCNGIMMNKPTVISTGEWLLPASVWPRPATDRTAPEYRHDLGKESGANVHVSRDEGATWVLRGQVHVPNRVFDEHMIVQRHDGSLWMLVRAAYGIGESFSLDCGKTWTPGRQSKIPHVNARFFIRRLNSGNLLLVTHEPPDGKSRSHLVARISEDDGKTWRGGLMIDTRPGISYPDGVQSRDGTIYLIYDYSRTGQKQILMATFKEDDATSGKWSSAAARQRVLVNQATFVPVDVRATSLPKIRVSAGGRTFETEDGRPFVPIAGELRSPLISPAKMGTRPELPWDRCLTSTFMGCKFAIPHLRKTRGSIINMSSAVAVMGQAGALAYVSTKAGQIGLTKAFALDLASDGVRVNAVCPAGVMTPLMRDWADSQYNAEAALATVDRWHPLGRMATAEEIGEVCAFLASAEASFITGQEICPDCGASLGYAEKAAARRQED